MISLNTEQNTKRRDQLKARMREDFYVKMDWWGENETILTDDEVKAEPLVIRKALAIRHTLRHMPAWVREYEYIVGIPNNFSVGLGREFTEFALPEEKKYALETSCMTPKQIVEVHPGDYAKLLRVGIKGLKAEINEQMAREVAKDEPDDEKMAFYRSMEIALDAVVEFAHRYSDICLKEARKKMKDDPQRAQELVEMAEILQRVPENPAGGFQEALQSFWLFYCVMHSCMDVMPVGRTDQYLYPYYKMDIESGKLTKDEARTLLTSFLVKFTERTQLNPEHWEWTHTTPIDETLGGADPEELSKYSFEVQNDADWNLGSSANHFLMNMIIGGLTPDGKDGTNDLTYMILEQTSYLETVSPVLSLRLHENSPREIIELAAKILSTGRGEPAIYRDENVIKGLVESGIPVEDARDYTNDGCWEVMVQGKTNYFYEHVHALKIMEYFMMHGKSLVTGEVEWRDCGDPSRYQSYDEFYEAYMHEVLSMANDVVDNYIKHKPTRYKINPSVLLSAITDDCIAKGRDIHNKGCRYTIYGLYITGYSHVIDSLAAIKKYVYDEKTLSMDELCEAMRTNYEGREDLRQMLQHEAPKYGNGDAFADEIAVKFIKDFSEFVKKKNEEPKVKEAQPNFMLSAACGTFEHYVMFGRDCGASADGRPYMYSVASNYSPSLGVDVKGPTATIRSATSPDLIKFYSGGPVDIGINAKDIQGKEGVDRLVSLIDSFGEMGGCIMTLQVMNTEQLRDAQVHPEKYPTLRVRMGGMSVYFNMLAKVQQDAIIRRAKG